MSSGKCPHSWTYSEKQLSSVAATSSATEAGKQKAASNRVETSSSSFLDLPPELQDMIYGYHVVNLQETGNLRLFDLKRLPVPALAKVCLQIRHDFFKVFFKEGRFSILLGQ